MLRYLKYSDDAGWQNYNTGSTDSNAVCRKFRYFAPTDDVRFYRVFYFPTFFTFLTIFVVFFNVFILRFLAFANSGPHFLVVRASHVTPARSLVDVGGLGSGLCRAVGRSTRNAAQLSRDSSFCESLRLNIRY